MKKEKFTTLHGMTGFGPTLTEAKMDAEHKIAMLIDELRKGPEVFAIGDWAIMLWRDAHGWASRIIKQPDGWRSNVVWGGTGHSGGYEKARYSVIRHLAHLTWSPDKHDGDVIGTAVGLLPSRGDNDEPLRLASELARYFKWQRDYAAARAAGKTDEEAREACWTSHP